MSAATDTREVKAPKQGRSPSEPPISLRVYTRSKDCLVSATPTRVLPLGSAGFTGEPHNVGTNHGHRAWRPKDEEGILFRQRQVGSHARSFAFYRQGGSRSQHSGRPGAKQETVSIPLQ